MASTSDPGAGMPQSAASTDAVEPRQAAASAVPDPLFILSPPRCFTSVVCAMLGQHPQMYGLPETGLFTVPTMELWWRRPRHVGLLRCVAQLFFGEQTDRSVIQAEAWLKRRLSFSTAYVFEELAARAAPRMLVEKTPAMVSELETLERTYEMFPGARYLHLLRHPRGHGQSVMNHVLHLAAEREVAPPRWVRHATSSTHRRRPGRRQPVRRDPQWDWFRLHNNILTFLEGVPPEQKLMMRGEDLLAEPDDNLRTIAQWLGLGTDDEVIEAMKHPERGPYSFIGPPNARFGTSRYFLEKPALRPVQGKPLSLQGPLEWREDGRWFAPRVRRLAASFGYT
jgi:Sulfotransferase family